MGLGTRCGYASKVKDWSPPTEKRKGSDMSLMQRGGTWSKISDPLSPSTIGYLHPKISIIPASP